MLVDISLPIKRGTVFRKGGMPVDISSRTFRNGTDGFYKADILTMALHTATHIDLVFAGKEFALERMIGQGRVFNVTKAGKNTITLNDLGNNQEVEEGDFVFFRTDWSKFLGTDRYFEHPELSLELINWLILKRINVVGIDAQGLARDPKHGDYDRLMLKNDIVVLENLVNLSALPKDKFRVYCFPVKIENADAMPARVVAEV